MYASSIEKVMNSKELGYESFILSMLGPDTDPLALASMLSERKWLKTEVLSASLLWVALNHKDKLGEYVAAFPDKRQLKNTLRYGSGVFKELGVNEAVNAALRAEKEVFKHMNLLVLTASTDAKMTFGTPKFTSTIDTVKKMEATWNRIAKKKYGTAILDEALHCVESSSQYKGVEVGKLLLLGGRYFYNTSNNGALELNFDPATKKLSAKLHQITTTTNGSCKLVDSKVTLPPIDCEEVVILEYYNNSDTVKGSTKFKTLDSLKRHLKNKYNKNKEV